MTALANLLCCRVGRLLVTYLGMSLRASFKSKSVWNPILGKYGHRLAASKRLYLPKGVWLTLFKSTFLSLSMYYLS